MCGRARVCNESWEVVYLTNMLLFEIISLRSLSEADTYEYIGMLQSLSIVDNDIKQTVKEHFFYRVIKVSCLGAIRGAFKCMGNFTHLLPRQAKIDSNRTECPR